MTNKELTIKETMEVLDGVEAIAVVVAKIVKDGKVGLNDLAFLSELVLKFDMLSKAVEGAGGSIDELKNLDQAELISLIGRVYAIVKAFEEAKK